MSHTVDCCAGIAAVVMALAPVAGSARPDAAAMIAGLPYSRDFHVVEFRRYTIKRGQRDAFARYFETFFPEAFQQLGALAVGQFFEQDHADGFTWIRAFKSMEDRAIVNSAFYYGPVWKEHMATLNDLMLDSDNVLLLTPLDAQRGMAILPAVDPVVEPTSERGVVLAQILQASPDTMMELTRRAAPMFEKYVAAGAREAAVYVSLNVPNNFPQLPIRTDGPYLVWIGLVPGDAAVKARVLAEMNRAGHILAETVPEQAPLGQVSTGQGVSLVRGLPEVIVMTPTARSRLRWLTGMEQAAPR